MSITAVIGAVLSGASIVAIIGVVLGGASLLWNIASALNSRRTRVSVSDRLWWVAGPNEWRVYVKATNKSRHAVHVDGVLLERDGGPHILLNTADATLPGDIQPRASEATWVSWELVERQGIKTSDPIRGIVELGDGKVVRSKIGPLDKKGEQGNGGWWKRLLSRDQRGFEEDESRRGLEP